MNNELDTEITVFLNEGGAHDQSKQSKLVSLVYDQLKNIAANRLRHESDSQTLTVTSLVHEAFISLSSLDDITWESRRHYFGAASEAMRRVLIDRARHHSRKNRGNEKNMIQLNDELHLAEIKPEELLNLDEALSQLERFNTEMAEIVKLKYFAGFSLNDIAELCNLSPRTVDRRWQSARAWLLSEIAEV